MMKYRALISFSGNITMAMGEVREIENKGIANDLLNAGYIEELKETKIKTKEPNKTIKSKNGTVDVTEYASAVVTVGEVTLSYDVNGGTGSIASVSVIAGGTVTLDSGATLTAPEGKEFAGWATASDATEPDATSPYKVSSNTTLYAVWDDVT